MDIVKYRECIPVYCVYQECASDIHKLAHKIMSLENLLANLLEIETWIDDAPNPDEFTSNDDLMRFSTKLMNYCLYLLKVGVSLSPDEVSAKRGFPKHKSIIMGHMIRIMKLYEGFLSHISNRRAELAAIFIRPLFETSIRMQYMIDSKTKGKTIRSFILASYRPEKEIIEDLEQKKNKRDLIKIEKRMLRKVKQRLRKDGITQQELKNNKRWRVDGKDFRSILRTLDLEHIYTYTFSTSSHYIHGDWHEIYYYHLEKDGRFYLPDPHFNNPDPRLSCPITGFLLNTLKSYIRWMKSDPDEVVFPVIEKLHKLNRQLDKAHEKTLSD